MHRELLGSCRLVEALAMQQIQLIQGHSTDQCQLAQGLQSIENSQLHKKKWKTTKNAIKNGI